jgi:hypothetical protein
MLPPAGGSRSSLLNPAALAEVDVESQSVKVALKRHAAQRAAEQAQERERWACRQLDLSSYVVLTLLVVSLLHTVPFFNNIPVLTVLVLLLPTSPQVQEGPGGGARQAQWWGWHAGWQLPVSPHIRTRG